MLFKRISNVVVVITLFFVQTSIAQTPLTDSISLNGIWKFKTDLYKVGAEQKWFLPTNSINSWDDMTVPGNWDTRNEYDHYTGDAWYQHSFFINEKLRSKHIRLVFESVYYDADFWLNGVKIGSNNLGFLAYEMQINKYLKYGAKNTLTVKVNNGFKLGAVWNWGGIRRPVWLAISNPVRVNHVAIDAVPDLSKGTADIALVTELVNHSSSNKAVACSIDIFYKGQLVGQSAWQSFNNIASGDTVIVKTNISLPANKVQLWHFDHPELYQAVIRLYQGKTQVHTHQETFGIRKIEVDGYALKLNGESIRPVGFNIVPEDRMYGNALPLERFKKMVDMMKECGANMARLSHTALPKPFLDYLDQKGIMTFEEVTLWGKDDHADPNDPLPKAWLQKLIRQQYNHPSVIGWSVGNEIGSYKNNPLVYEYVKGAIAMAKALNPNRLATYATNTAQSQPNDAAGLCDIILLNAYGGWGRAAEQAHKHFPGKPIFFSEYGWNLNDEDLDKSFLGAEKMFTDMRGKEYVIGASLWTFNDYRSNYWSARAGWATPVSENRTWGVVNSFLQPKKSYYEVRKTNLPFLITNCNIRSAGNNCSGSISLQTRAIPSFPAYILKGYVVTISTKDKTGKIINQQSYPLPTLQPGDSVKNLAFSLPVSASANSIMLQIKDAQNYSRYDTTVYLSKPTTPELLAVHSSDVAARIVFKKMPDATAYYLKYGSHDLNNTSPQTTNDFIELSNLNRDSIYQFQLVAVNNAGATATEKQTFALGKKELPPIVWNVQAVKQGFFVSYNSDPLDFRYEIAYGVKPNNYDKNLVLNTKGVLQVPGLVSGKTYYFKMRRILQWGYNSAWTHEYVITAQ